VRTSHTCLALRGSITLGLHSSHVFDIWDTQSDMLLWHRDPANCHMHDDFGRVQTLPSACHPCQNHESPTHNMGRPRQQVAGMKPSTRADSHTCWCCCWLFFMHTWCVHAYLCSQRSWASAGCWLQCNHSAVYCWSQAAAAAVLLHFSCVTGCAALCLPCRRRRTQLSCQHCSARGAGCTMDAQS
jgi:hypothetical protein